MRYRGTHPTVLQCRATARVRTRTRARRFVQMSQPITPADQLLAKCEMLRVLSGEGYYKFKAVRAPRRRLLVQPGTCNAAFHITSQHVKSRRGFQEISILCDPSSRVVLYVTNKWFKEMYAEDTHGSKGCCTLIN